MPIYDESAGRIGPNRIESLNRAKKLMPIDTNQNTASFKKIPGVWYGKFQNTTRKSIPISTKGYLRWQRYLHPFAFLIPFYIFDPTQERSGIYQKEYST